MKKTVPESTRSRGDHRGQTLIFLMMIMIILAFVMFSVYDTQHVIVQRVRTQNAADAAALTGARWQLSALNAIGEINLMKLTTKIIIDVPPGNIPGDPKNPLWSNIFAALDQLQSRIYFTGPLLGVLYAQQAAKLNRMHMVNGYETCFLQAVRDVQRDYALYLPYMGYDFRDDYINLMGQIAAEGVAARPRNAFGDDGNMDLTGANNLAYFLLRRDFYNAIASRDYCYFHQGSARQLLNEYPDGAGNWGYWGEIKRGTPPNPFRFLSLHLTTTNWTASSIIQPGLLSAVQRGLGDRGIGANLNPNWTNYTANFDANFPQFYYPAFGDTFVSLRLMIYDNEYWDWNRRRPDQSYVTGGVIDGDYQPALMRSDFNDAFKYKGAASSWDVQAAANISMAVIRPDRTEWTSRGQEAGLKQAFDDLSSLKGAASGTSYAPSSESKGIRSSAAAKPFIRFGSTAKPHDYQVVLPVFTDVRLLPVVLAENTTGDSSDGAMMEHVRVDLPAAEPPDYPDPGYTDRGIYARGCWLCKQLKEWDTGTFRADCKAYLQRPNPCPPGGGGGRGGGGPSH